MSRNTLARIAGILYLIVALCGGFSQLVVRQGALVAGDAAATADNIRASAAVFRIGFVTDAANVLAFVLLAFVLYALLAQINARIAGTFVVLNAIAAAVMGVSLVGQASALALATEPMYMTSLGTAAADVLSLLFLDLHRYGYLVAEIFFGLWLLPLGYLVYRSGFFPRAIGVLLMVGAVSYLASFAATVSSPGFVESGLSLAVAMPAALGEISFLLWLLVRGAKDQPSDAHAPALADASAAVS